MSANACQFCGKALSRIRLLRDGDFCNREHREQFRLRQGMNRVLEASEVSVLERRKERPQLIALQRPAVRAGSGRRRLTPQAPPLRGAPSEFSLPAPALWTAGRPVGAGAVPACYGPGTRSSLRRTDSPVVRLRTRLEFRLSGPFPRGEAVRTALRASGFDFLLGAAGPPAAAIRMGAGQPLEARPTIPLPAPRLSLCEGPRDLPAAAFTSEVRQSAAPAGCGSPRGTGAVDFPSARLEPPVPVPPPARRTGKPARIADGRLAAYRVRMQAAPAGRRTFEERLQTVFDWREFPGRSGRRTAGTARMAGSGSLMRARNASGPRQTPAVKRAAGAPDFWSAIPAFFRIAIPAFEIPPAPALCEMPDTNRPFVVPRQSSRRTRRRTSGVPQPPRSVRMPAWGAAIVAWSWRHGAPPEMVRNSPAAAGRGKARQCGPIGILPDRPAIVLPVLRPRAAAPASATLATPAPPVPCRMPEATGAGTFAPRPELARFAAASPRLRTMPLGILAMIGNNLDGAGANAAVEDNFGSGLGRWVGALDNWRLDAAGVRPGSLALFTPSLGLRDYGMEFLAKVEARGIGWVCRAADFSNYYLLRLSAAGEGGTAALELTRQAVIAGVAEQPVSVALPVTMRSRAAFRVETCVSGAEFTLSVEGQRVYGWSDSRLKTGGIGFLSGQEDRARLYWVKLSPSGRAATAGAGGV